MEVRQGPRRAPARQGRRKVKLPARDLGQRRIDDKVGTDPFNGASRADYVYQQIRQAMRDGRFRQGDRVREEDVAKSLGVSRTPVREALRQLQSDGLLDVISGRGLGVVALDRSQVLELYAMRELLEGAAARLAAQHATPAEVAYMEHLLASFRRTRDPEQHAQFNRALHVAIRDAAHNRYMVQSLNQLSDALALLQGTTFSISGRARTADLEHRAIVHAIAAGNSDLAEAAARTHIRQAQALRMQMLPL